MAAFLDLLVIAMVAIALIAAALISSRPILAEGRDSITGRNIWVAHHALFTFINVRAGVLQIVFTVSPFTAAAIVAIQNFTRTVLRARTLVVRGTAER